MGEREHAADAAAARGDNGDSKNEQSSPQLEDERTDAGQTNGVAHTAEADDTVPDGDGDGLSQAGWHETGDEHATGRVDSGAQGHGHGEEMGRQDGDHGQDADEELDA